MKITNLQISITPWYRTDYKEFRVCVIADGRAFTATRPIRENDFEGLFDVLMRETTLEIKRLAKEKEIT